MREDKIFDYWQLWGYILDIGDSIEDNLRCRSNLLMRDTNRLLPREEISSRLLWY